VWVALVVWLLPLNDLLSHTSDSPTVLGRYSLSYIILLVGYGALALVALGAAWFAPRLIRHAPVSWSRIVLLAVVVLGGSGLGWHLFRTTRATFNGPPPLSLEIAVWTWAALYVLALIVLKMDPARVHWRAVSGVGITSLLVAILGSELLLAVAFPDKQGRILYDVVTPGQPNPWRKYVGRSRPINTEYLLYGNYGVASLFYTNSHGLYDQEYAYEKPPGVFRILLLGDSLAESKEVVLAETFHQRLEDRLRAEGRNVEVISGAVSGWGTTDELRYLQYEGCRYEPDMVVLAAFPTNDIGNNHRVTSAWQIRDTASSEAVFKWFLASPYHELSENGELVEHNVPMQDDPLSSNQVYPLTLGERIGSILARYSRIYRIIHRASRLREDASTAPAPSELDMFYDDYQGVEPPDVRNNGGVNILTYLEPDTPVMGEAWAITEQIIRRMREVAQNCGAEIIVTFVIPPRVDRQANNTLFTTRLQALTAENPSFWGDYRYRDADQRFASLMETQLGLPTLHLGDVLAGQDNDQVFIPGDGHFTPLGHQLVADALYRWMIEEGWLPQASNSQNE
jgi:lysophospholipase L1-like esterase